ncbi:hypothetical protein CAPN001_19970 [Capnocytophaga stomatis]|uniref:Uncharacterized protein n=1 Tax=Capnocytophaga stomatis TaxID=1848904 RepID=A0A250FXD1_9FLAO|nr:hypothetical protein [Capnocytophaga stomatis]ATA89723.1 hypothetical protein CGC58_08275 [Capnocytophaga stomatis]GIJ97428.1 hypothetical protein CAPN001_19970 [Capnocytophaga stomatis]
MKTSNKLLLLAFSIIVIFPIIEFFIIKSMKETKIPSVKYRWEYVKDSLEIKKLPDFKHLKIIGEEEMLDAIGEILFVYKDSSYAFVDYSLNRESMLFTSNNDTLTLKLDKNIGGNCNYLHFICIHSPILESVSLQNVKFRVNTLSKHRNKTIATFNLNKSRIYFDDDDYKDDYYKYFQLKNEMSYQKIILKGIDSEFILNEMRSDTIKVDIKGNSSFSSRAIYNDISGNVSRETKIYYNNDNNINIE